MVLTALWYRHPSWDRNRVSAGFCCLCYELTVSREAEGRVPCAISTSTVFGVILMITNSWLFELLLSVTYFMCAPEDDFGVPFASHPAYRQLTNIIYKLSLQNVPAPSFCHYSRCSKGTSSWPRVDKCSFRSGPLHSSLIFPQVRSHCPSAPGSRSASTSVKVKCEVLTRTDKASGTSFS